MEFDLTDEQRRFVIQFLVNASYPINKKEESLLFRFADLLEHCGKVGSTLHIN